MQIYLITTLKRCVLLSFIDSIAIFFPKACISSKNCIWCPSIWSKQCCITAGMDLLLIFHVFWLSNVPHWFLTMKQNSLQLMFSKFEYDGELNPTFVEGSFELPVSSIRAYIKEPIKPRYTIALSFWLSFPFFWHAWVFIVHFFCATYRFVHVSAAGVTRPERPGLDLSKQPPAVRLNKELGYILTFKLKVQSWWWLLVCHRYIAKFSVSTWISFANSGQCCQ